MPNAGEAVLAADFPVAVQHIQDADETAFTDTSFTKGSNVCGAAFIAPTSGAVVLHWFADCTSNTNGIAVLVGSAVYTGSTVGSGSAVSAADATQSLRWEDTAAVRTAQGMSRLVTGLTAGAAYNAFLQHTLNGAGNGTVYNRSIVVCPTT